MLWLLSFAVLTTVSSAVCSAVVCFIPSSRFLFYLHGIMHYGNYVLASPENVPIKSVKEKGNISCLMFQRTCADMRNPPSLGSSVKLLKSVEWRKLRPIEDCRNGGGTHSHLSFENVFRRLFECVPVDLIPKCLLHLIPPSWCWFRWTVFYSSRRLVYPL